MEQSLFTPRLAAYTAAQTNALEAMLPNEMVVPEPGGIKA